MDKTKGAVAPRQVNVRTVQNIFLVWLDSNIDTNNNDCQTTITRLRHVINDISTFTDGDECIKFIQNIHDSKACMIISGSPGQHIVPQVHDMSQVDSIFIFCGNKKRHEQWAKEWPKIKGVFTEISSICEALKQAVQQSEQNTTAISIVPTNDNVTHKNLDQLDPSFMYTQILKEILSTLAFQQQHVKEFADYCREQFAENDQQLNNIKKMEREYQKNTPIWWYTYECFLCPMLNRALRTIDVNIIIKMGFFLADLHRHIVRLHSEQFGGHNSGKTFTVYRGQGMPKEDFEQLKKNQGGLLSFNNFLSTNKDRETSLAFVHSAVENSDVVGVLIVMAIDPSQATVPFADITNVSYYQTSDEVLFSMHTVFRIRDIKPLDKNNRLFEINLELTTDTDNNLRMLKNLIQEEISSSSSGWDRLSRLLSKMGKTDEALQINNVLLAQATNDTEKGDIYERLGMNKYNLGEYTEALTFHEKALETRQKTLPPNHPNLSSSYNNIGLVYFNMEDYSKALSCYEKAFEIRQRSLPPNHPDLAPSYNNIGLVYNKMFKFLKALSYFEKALAIQQKTLPPNHPDLSSSYKNIGWAYNNLGEYSKALSYYEKALEIRQRSLPPGHPDLASSHNDIGLVYENTGDYPNACSYYERTVDIGQHLLPPNHPQLQKWKKDLENIKEKL